MMLCHRVLCPLKTGSFEAGVFGYSFLAGRGVETHEGIEVHGGAEGVHPEAGRAGNTCRRDMSQGEDQLGDLFQLEEEVWRAVAG